MSLACPRGRPQPGPWSQPRRLPRTPRPSPDTRSRPSASAPCALTGAWGPPSRARPGAPAAPAHPSSPPGLIPGPLPAAPPRTHSSPPAACKASERSPSRDGAPPKMPGAPGHPGERLCRRPWVWALGLLSWDPPWLPPSVFPPRQTFSGLFRGSAWEGALQLSFPDFGTIPVSSPRVSPPWVPDRAPHPRHRRVPRRERGREKKPGLPCPSPAGVRPGQGVAPADPVSGGKFWTKGIDY